MGLSDRYFLVASVEALSFYTCDDAQASDANTCADAAAPFSGGGAVTTGPHSGGSAVAAAAAAAGSGVRNVASPPARSRSMRRSRSVQGFELLGLGGRSNSGGGAGDWLSAATTPGSETASEDGVSSPCSALSPGAGDQMFCATIPFVQESILYAFLIFFAVVLALAVAPSSA